MEKRQEWSTNRKGEIATGEGLGKMREKAQEGTEKREWRGKDREETSKNGDGESRKEDHEIVQKQELKLIHDQCTHQCSRVYKTCV